MGKLLGMKHEMARAPFHEFACGKHRPPRPFKNLTKGIIMGKGGNASASVQRYCRKLRGAYPQVLRSKILQFRLRNRTPLYGTGIGALERVNFSRSEKEGETERQAVH